MADEGLDWGLGAQPRGGAPRAAITTTLGQPAARLLLERTRTAPHLPDWAIALAIVLGMRVVYLLFHGWQGSWMNWNYLHEAKFFLTGLGQQEHGPPLTALMLATARMAGMSALSAVALLYVVGHALFAAGTLYVGRFVWPAASRRRLLLLACVIAVIPGLSTEEGYKNVAVLLGAGLAIVGVALALLASTSERSRPAALLAIAIVATLGGCCRFESAATLGGCALTLLLLGRKMDGIRRTFTPAIALLAGSAAGVCLTFLMRWAFSGEADVMSSTYSLYTFYDGLPMAMWPWDLFEHPSEYARYAASAAYFGTAADNGGSVLQAMANHPGWALVRIIGKIPDLLVGLAWMDGLSPLCFAAAIVGLRSMPKRSGSAVARGWIALAFVAPLLFLFGPTSWSAHLIPLMPIACLAAARGIDGWTIRLKGWRGGIALTLVLAAVASGVAAAGLMPACNARVLNETAEYLEARCRNGCIVNYVPHQVSGQVLANLQAASPLPRKVKTSEEFVFQRHSKAFLAGCSFDARLRSAKGSSAPALYIDFRIRSAKVFDEDFDPERSCEGGVDLSTATLEKTLRHGEDEVRIYALPMPWSADQGG